jgi:hypothetical protein
MIKLREHSDWEKFFTCGFNSMADFRKAFDGRSRLVKKLLNSRGFQSGKIDIPRLGPVRLGKNEFYRCQRVEDAKAAYESLKEFLDKCPENAENYLSIGGFYNEIELTDNTGSKRATFHIIIVQQQKDYERYLDAFFYLNKKFLETKRTK